MDEKDGINAPYYSRFEGESHHGGEYQNYLEAGTTPLPDLREGIHTLAVLEDMERSLASGQVESVTRVLRDWHLEL